MIKPNSIFFTISLLFFIAAMSIVASYFVLHRTNILQHQDFLERKHIAVSRIMVNAHRDKVFGKELQSSLQSLNYELITDANRIRTLLKTPAIKRFLSKKLSRNAVVHFYLYNNHHYLLLHTGDTRYLLKDNTPAHFFNTTLQLIFLGIFILVAGLYLLTARKLYPLKVLTDHMSRLGEESFDIDYRVKGGDEVAQLAREFVKSVQRLEALKESRNIFIRNIMHELKTPILKGKLLTELPHNEENTQKMREVFTRLENLINEFASIEELIAATRKIEKQRCTLEDIIDNAKDMLLYDEESKSIIFKEQICEKVVHVNFKLFSIAVKNLLDNAIKYAEDKKVYLECKGDHLVFSNRGAPLQAPLQKYFEPFIKGQQQVTASFGLGLYIVHKILQVHGFALRYRYENGYNRFEVHTHDPD